MLGAMQFFVTASRSYAINNLHGAVYVILSNLSIVWNFALSKAFLRASFSTYHHAAIAFTLAAAGMASRYQPHDEAEFVRNSRPSWKWGIASCVCYSILTAATSVLASKVLKDAGADKRSIIVVSELSFANSFIPAAIALPVVLLANLGPLWEDTWDHVENEEPYKVESKYNAEFEVLAILVVLSLSKMADRLSKFALINVSSAFFFQILNALISGGQALLAIAIFRDQMTSGVVIALLLLAFALACTIAGDRQVSLRTHRRTSGERHQRQPRDRGRSSQGWLESATWDGSGLAVEGTARNGCSMAAVV